MNKKDENFADFLECLEKRSNFAVNKPVQLIFGLTNVCNLHCAFCPYCGFCMSKIEMVHMIPLELIQKLRPHLERAKFINPSGRGEPLLYKNFDDFLDICRECDALNSMLLINNGTQLGRIDKLKLDGVNIIGISIDSVDKKTFEILRYGADFEQVMYNIISLRSALKNTVLQWCVVVNRLNINQLVDIYAKAREIGIDYITFNDVYGYEEDKVITLLRLRESDRYIVEEQFRQIQELNADNKLVVSNIITWGGYEDGVKLDIDDVISQLSSLKEQEPYLDFDQINCTDTESRMIKLEERKDILDKEIRLPYCTNPFETIFIQPDLSVSPCCATFGTIDQIEDNDIEAVWNGENYRLLREAMFNYEMLPEYCKKCEAFSRYDYINDFIEKLKKSGKLDYERLVIPPNYRPYEGLIADEKISQMIEWNKARYRKDEFKPLEINSLDYWNNRFGGDWKEKKGNGQTRFFANLVCLLIPESLKKEIVENNYHILDVGCAEGDAVGILSRFFSAPVTGIDFSDVAVANGRKKYPGTELLVRDINNLDDIEVDVVYCSNFLEQFPDPWKVFERLESIARKYIILCIPYKEEVYCPEHLYVFNEENILIDGRKFHLVFEDIIDCSAVENSFYPGKQMLLVYGIEQKERNLKSLSRGLIEESLQRANLKYLSKEDELNQVINNLVNENEEYKIYKKELDDLLERYHTQRIETKELLDLNLALKSQLEIMEEDSEQKEIEFQRKENEFIQKLECQENLMFLAKNECFRYNSKALYKLFRVANRFVEQFIRGNREERKDFRKLLRSSILKKRIIGTRTDGFNPMYNIINILDGVEYGGKSTIEILEGVTDKKEQFEVRLSSQTKEILKEMYNKSDIIILSVINYDFRHQRPQHFASRFAANGHRVFYINANFSGKDCVKEISDGLFTVDFSNRHLNSVYDMDCNKSLPWISEKMDSLIQEYAIRDAITIVDYPNWISGADYLRKKYGYAIVTDYMDDFTGFLGTTTSTLKDNCIKLLQESDLVVVSSQFLYEIAVRYAKKVTIIRNGTEVEHFYKALENEYHKARKVVGYYGAVAHWFAWEKVCYLAENLPECDIVIIGEVTEHKDELERYQNIKLLGEMPYTKLPEQLAYFDVCLIPFDTSTDLIKATNPVKFYEYLSAGKRVVATEIPELEPFRDQFVYMSNDNKEFLEYVQLCLEGKDVLKDKKECVEFARGNDWQKRFERFEASCLDVMPKVSVIVLTYNNLELNRKCIQSIIDNTGYPNYELIIVDNKSTDGTVEYLHEVEQWNNGKIKIIFNQENSGFAGGNNIAISQSTGDYILLLNNDTVVTRGWITNMVKHLKQNPNYGMCGAVTNSIGNEAQINVKYSNYNELLEFAFAYTQIHMGEEYNNADRLAMFCAMIPKGIISKCGMLDDNYKVGMFEDDDYAQAVKKQGFELVIAEDAFIHHVNNASFKKIDDKEYNEIFEANKKLFEEKWNTKWTCPKYREGVDWSSNRNVNL